MINKRPKLNLNQCANRKAGERYNRIVDIINNPGYVIWVTTDGKHEVNLLAIWKTIEKKIKHLGVEEQKAIKIKHQRFALLKAQLGRNKRLAFNANVAPNEGVLESKKAEILELFGRYYSVDEVHKKLLEDGIPLNLTSVRRFQVKYKDEIEKLQIEHDKDYGTIGVARKRGRLEKYDYMIRVYQDLFDEKEGKNKLPYGKEIIKVLEQARKEVEGEVLRHEITGGINVTATIESNKSVHELYSDINFMQYLLARVAVKLNTSPMLLQHQLANSWYSRFSGFRRNDDYLTEEPNYPSSMIMNWEETREKAAKKEREREDMMSKFKHKIEDVGEITEEGKEFKDSLKKKIGERRDYVKSRQDAKDKDIRELIAKIKKKKDK